MIHPSIALSQKSYDRHSSEVINPLLQGFCACELVNSWCTRIHRTRAMYIRVIQLGWNSLVLGTLNHRPLNQNVTRNTLMLFHAMLAGFLPLLGRWKLIKSYLHCILAGERVNFSCLKNIWFCSFYNMLHQLIHIIMFSWLRSRSFGIANLGYPDTLHTSITKCYSSEVPILLLLPANIPLQ